MAQAARDANYVPTIIGVSSLDLATPTRIAANPVTGALLIDGTSLYTTLDTRYLMLNGTNDPLTGDLTLNNTATALTMPGFTATGVPYFGTGGLMSADAAYFYYTIATHTLYSYILSSTALQLSGWTTASIPFMSATGYLTEDTDFNFATGTNTLNSPNITATGVITAANFVSNVATTTQPYACTSTTLNTNLNVDLLDGQHGSYYLDSAYFTGTNWTDLTDGGNTTLHKHDIYILADGTRALTGAWDAGAFVITANGFTVGDSEPISLGAGTDAVLQFDQTQAIDSLQLGLLVNNNEYSGYFSLMEKADIGNANRTPLAVSVDPVFRVYSSDAASNLDYIEIFHNQTTGVLQSGTDNISFGNDTLTTTASIAGANFVSTIAIGTSPYACTSTTLNTNLNADAVDSLHAQTLTATSPITLSGTTSVLAAAGITIAHATTAGNIHLPAAGAAGQIITYAAAGTGAWTTATYPATTTAYQLLISTGTNAIGELTAGTTGKLLMGTTGAVPIWTTPTFPNAATTTGAYLRADGTNFIQSTLVLPNAGTAYKLAVYTGTNTLGELAAVGVDGEILIGVTAKIPIWSAEPTLTTSLTVPTIYGSSAANGDITIAGTASATKTSSYVILQPTGGFVGIGQTTPTAALDILAPALGSGVIEYLQRWSVADNATSYLSIENTTGGLNYFVPGIVGYFDGSAGTSLYIISKCTAGNDSGTEPLIAVDGRQTGAALTSRPIIDFRTYGNKKVTITYGGRIGVLTNTPTAQVHIDQSSTTGAIPVLTVDQADVSEEFIRFIGTSANGVLTQSIVEAADVSTATIAGYLKIFISDDGNQITDAAYYVAFYSLV